MIIDGYDTLDWGAYVPPIFFNRKVYILGYLPSNMKQLSLRYDDEDYHKLKTAKDKTILSWERFILSLLKGGKDGKNKD